jgi:hypothetical protein
VRTGVSLARWYYDGEASLPKVPTYKTDPVYPPKPDPYGLKDTRPSPRFLASSLFNGANWRFGKASSQGSNV